MTFSVEVKNAGEASTSQHAVHIYISPDEIDQLILDLQQLKKSEIGGSVHLFSPSWGNGDLTEKLHRSDTVITHHLEISTAE